ncbi:GDSL-type esterase/lipase family protein [uncultured Brevibacterium sp.]|uniref:GDSL-type esterase/lipase family protein n=1 Tax=uncultured Brevibacterium sp. TaxID=189678 RepID=UPI0025DC9BE8|nr:GDSL-type esterase/lipase family protein [uncultured Brevibacterium sp.]
MTLKKTTIVVAGDELVAGHGDARSLGWAGRVAVRTHPSLANAEFYTLSVPQEDTGAFAQRAFAEAQLRFSDSGINRLVLAPGSRDVDAGLSTARSRLNLANVLDEALAAEVSTFVVGPTPGRSESRNEKVAQLSAGFADVAHRRAVPYVDCFSPLKSHPVWQRDLASSSREIPAQEGYGLITWLVLNRGWYDWLGVQNVMEG